MVEMTHVKVYKVLMSGASGYTDFLYPCLHVTLLVSMIHMNIEHYVGFESSNLLLGDGL